MRKLVRKAAAGQAIAPATTMQLDSSLLGLKNSLSGLATSTTGQLANTMTFGQKLNGFINNPNINSLGTSILGGVTNLISGPKENADPLISGLGGLSTNILNQVNPAAGLVNAGSNLLNAGIGKLVGKSTDYSDKAGQAFDKATDWLNMAGPLGMAANFVLDLGNMLGSKTIEGVDVSDKAKAMQGGYQGTISKAESMGDKNFSGVTRLFSNKDKKYARDVENMQQKISTIEDIGDQAKLDFLASNNPLLQNRLQTSRTGGFQATAVGEKGMKLESNLYWARQLLSRMAKAQNTAQLYKDGGKMNIIPTGALHKELHHIDQDNITKKGIPVVTDNNGQIEQQAEIEKEEWILNAKQSNQIEELRDKYNASIDEQEKNQIAIEAGKIIVDELLYNTVDKGKLLKQVS